MLDGNWFHDQSTRSHRRMDTARPTADIRRADIFASHFGRTTTQLFERGSSVGIPFDHTATFEMAIAICGQADRAFSCSSDVQLLSLPRRVAFQEYSISRYGFSLLKLADRVSPFRETRRM